MDDATWNKKLKEFKYREHKGPYYHTLSNFTWWSVFVSKGGTEIDTSGVTLIQAREKAITCIQHREALRNGTLKVKE